ncbi:hypothetical protein ACFX1X_025803 [Malus domestica]
MLQSCNGQATIFFADYSFLHLFSFLSTDCLNGYAFWKTSHPATVRIEIEAAKNRATVTEENERDARLVATSLQNDISPAAPFLGEHR